MSTPRLIARLDIKAPNLIKGIHLEGLRVMGDPQKFAQQYYEQGADELLYIDIVASLYQRNGLTELVEKTAQNVFIPITVGGGIRSVDDVSMMLRAGADKVAVNTAAIKRPELITEIGNRFGAQCMVLSIEARKTSSDRWEAFTDNGRELTGLNAVEWAVEGVKRGAGEILVTSIDQEGTTKGFDCELTKAISDVVSVPVIASGGMGTPAHLTKVIKEGHADAVAMAHVLHYKKLTFTDMRNELTANGISVRSK